MCEEALSDDCVLIRRKHISVRSKAVVARIVCGFGV